mgnify:CR=1 FL=1
MGNTLATSPVVWEWLPSRPASAPARARPRRGPEAGGGAFCFYHLSARPPSLRPLATCEPIWRAVDHSRRRRSTMSATSTAAPSPASYEAAQARAAVLSCRAPSVARPHATIDLDKARAKPSSGKPKEFVRLSDGQRRKLRKVLFVHLQQISVWRKKRGLVRRSGKAKPPVKWTPPPPRIDWHAVAHSHDYGIYTTSETARRWIEKYRRNLRREILDGERLGCPEWAVSRLASLP